MDKKRGRNYDPGSLKPERYAVTVRIDFEVAFLTACATALGPSDPGVPAVGTLPGSLRHSDASRRDDATRAEGASAEREREAAEQQPAPLHGRPARRRCGGRRAVERRPHSLPHDLLEALPRPPRVAEPALRVSSRE